MAETGFQLRGNAAQQYEQNNVPRILRPQAEALFDQVSLQEGDRVLDVACGTGIVTRVAVERCGKLASIVGLDFNAGMLEMTRANTPQTHIPIKWQQGDMCAPHSPMTLLTLYYVNKAYSSLPINWLALRHMQRVLAPAGRLAFTVWSQPHTISEVVADAVAFSERGSSRCRLRQCGSLTVYA